MKRITAFDEPTLTETLIHALSGIYDTFCAVETMDIPAVFTKENERTLANLLNSIEDEAHVLRGFLGLQHDCNPREYTRIVGYVVTDHGAYAVMATWTRGFSKLCTLSFVGWPDLIDANVAMCAWMDKRRMEVLAKKKSC